MVFDFIRKHLSDFLGLDEEYIKMDSRLTEDLEMDELDRVDFAMDLEDEYNVEIDDETLEMFKTISDVVKYIEEHT